LRKLFRRVTGMSPARFVQRRRLERACALLRLSDMKIEEVAERCGFSGAPNRKLVSEYASCPAKFPSSYFS